MNSATQTDEERPFVAKFQPIMASNQQFNVNDIKMGGAPLPGRRPIGKPPPPKPAKHPKPALHRGGRVGQSQSGSGSSPPMPVTEQEGKHSVIFHLIGFLLISR